MASGPFPTNDELANASLITAGATFQSTTGASTAPGEDVRAEPSGFDQVGSTVWFRYVAPTTGTSSVNTFGSNFDTTLQVFALTNPSQPVSYSNLTQIASNDDSRIGSTVNPDFRNSTVDFSASAGQTYYIQVGGFRPATISEGQTGNLSLNVTPVCFVSGTLIRTRRGDVPVEHLAIGDLALTASGDQRPIRWIGCTTLDCRGREARAVQPVRIAAGAFGESQPSLDLFVSPGHAVCIDVLGEVLIPASRLVNGATVAQVEVDAVTYWHVELDSHDILIANGLPAESYIDCGNRDFFATEQGAIDPVRTGSVADYCRPLADETVIKAVRSRLRDRALALGWQLDTDPLADLHIVADGRVIRPEVDGATARFLLPVEAKEVWLASNASVPADMGDSGDGRCLGVDVCALSVDDGLTGRREIALDDPRLDAGFHALETEGGAHRWTDGRANLPASLWAGCRGHVFVRVECQANDLTRWVAPAGAIEVSRPIAAMPHLRLVVSAA
ncbi:MAG: Hint domain-containing protein [Methylobacterium sp.]|uniref:Hint domain-containing protein n=1 Tax=Methylobacterium sp. TaxID=409 RepID=UPI00258E6D53|nr:Hint domain-containing protein [Methylobacterium sp.]MBY0297433.1 Hint domain-containing protein [Methylobacterium sp.]